MAAHECCNSRFGWNSKNYSHLDCKSLRDNLGLLLFCEESDVLRELRSGLHEVECTVEVGLHLMAMNDRVEKALF
jgi:hypothetical protein